MSNRPATTLGRGCRRFAPRGFNDLQRAWAVAVEQTWPWFSAGHSQPECSSGIPVHACDNFTTPATSPAAIADRPRQAGTLAPSADRGTTSVSDGNVRARAFENAASFFLRTCHVSVGESWSEGIGRPAPDDAGVGPLCPPLSVSVGAAPSLWAPEVALTLASRSAATCDTGSGAGGRASTFRTAPGLLSPPRGRPVRDRRHGHATLRRSRAVSPAEGISPGGAAKGNIRFMLSH